MKQNLTETLPARWPLFTLIAVALLSVITYNPVSSFFAAVFGPESSYTATHVFFDVLMLSATVLAFVLGRRMHFNAMAYIGLSLLVVYLFLSWGMIAAIYAMESYDMYAMLNVTHGVMCLLNFAAWLLIMMGSRADNVLKILIPLLPLLDMVRSWFLSGSYFVDSLIPSVDETSNHIIISLRYIALAYSIWWLMRGRKPLQK